MQIFAETFKMFLRTHSFWSTLSNSLSLGLKLVQFRLLIIELMQNYWELTMPKFHQLSALRPAAGFAQNRRPIAQRKKNMRSESERWGQDWRLPRFTEAKSMRHIPLLAFGVGWCSIGCYPTSLSAGRTRKAGPVTMVPVKKGRRFTTSWGWGGRWSA